LASEHPVRANMKGSKLIDAAITSSLLETVQDILKNNILLLFKTA
jgi:hypothetical protein